jgi:hypothetical protein
VAGGVISGGSWDATCSVMTHTTGNAGRLVDPKTTDAISCYRAARDGRSATRAAPSAFRTQSAELVCGVTIPRSGGPFKGLDAVAVRVLGL